MDNNIEVYHERMPKFESECGFSHTGELSNTCDTPNLVGNNTPAVKMEPESNNYCEDYGDHNRVNAETCNGPNHSNSNAEVDGRTRSRNRVIRNNQDHSGIGSSKPKRTGLKRISYCEDTSSAESESDSEYSSPRKKRTQTFKLPPKRADRSTTYLPSLTQVPEIPSSVPVIKQEPSPVVKCETDEKCSVNVKLVKDVSNKRGKNKWKVIKKKSTDTNEISFEEILKIVKSNHGRKDYRITDNRSILRAFEKYLIYRCLVCTSDFDNMDCAKEHFEKEHSNPSSTESNKDEFVEHFTKLYKCDQCEKTENHLRNLIKHLDSFHNGEEEVLYSCDKCAFTTFDKYKLSSHMKSHIYPQEKTECQLCHVSVVEIKRHLKRMHSDITVKCPLCPKTFKSYEAVKWHQKRVHIDKKLACKDCGEVFKNLTCLRQHARQHYEIEPRFECLICKNKFKTKNILDEHLNSHGCGHTSETSKPSKFSDDVIQDVLVGGMIMHKSKIVLKKKTVISKYIKKKTAISKDIKKTTAISKDITFEEASEILRTNSDKHIGGRINSRYIMAACQIGCKKYLIYRCRVCTRDFDNLELAKDHFEKEHSDPKTDSDKDKFEKFYKCDRCAKTLLTRGLRLFLKHLDSCHNGEEVLYSCDKCNSFTTLDKYRYLSHVKFHDKKKKKIREKTECHLCHLSFTHIKIHLQNMHSESKIKCPLCPNTFGSEHLVKTHRVKVHAAVTNIVCKECEKYLRTHLRTHYKTERLECPLCKSKLKNKTTFESHMVRIHGVGSKFLTCKYCTRRFTKNVTLLNHIRREHDPNCEEPKKNHLCETCGKSFILNQTLERHMVVHTKEKKFVCATCNKGFTQMDSLKSHQVVHTGIKPFECGKCGQKYSQKYPLTQHIKKHHPN